LIHRWQPLAIMAAVGLILSAGTATAQTVIVKGAATGSSFELIRNGTQVDTATVDATGLATLVVPEASRGGSNQIEAHVFLDRCGEVWRVLLAEGSLAPPASAACTRQALPGFFIVRPTTSFVIDVAPSNAVLLLTQGRVPQSWLRAGPDVAGAVDRLAPTGLLLFGGAGMALGGDIDTVACGTTVAACTADTKRLSYGGGVAYWLTPNIGLEGAYAAPEDATAEGSDTGLRFNSSMQARFVTISGLVGGPVGGRGRMYARAGVNRHRAVLNTSQTVDDATVTVGEETVTIPGASQTLELRTAGWGYVFGGGFEVWMGSRLAIYGDLNRISINGKTEDASLRTIKEGLWLAQVGVRIHIGR
jgi:hypothetical protein